jgi:hypothetical protein
MVGEATHAAVAKVDGIEADDAALPAGVSAEWWAEADGIVRPRRYLEGGPSEARFGWSVGTAGDVNGDGYDDGIVGAPLFDHGEEDEGAAVLFLGLSTAPR